MLTKTDSSRKTSAKDVGTVKGGGVYQVPDLKQVPEEVETGRLVHAGTPSSRGLFFFSTVLECVARYRAVPPVCVYYLWYIYCLLVQVLW